MSQATGQSMVDRVARTAFLIPSAYEEVEHDSGATIQALGVVALTAVAGGVGGGLAGGVPGIIGGVTAAIVGWFLFALIAYWVGTSVFKGPHTRASLGELLRTVGFAQSPGILLILGFLPIAGIIITAAVLVWGFLAVVIAVRQALDFDTVSAVKTVVVAWLARVALLFIVFLVF